MKSKYTVLPINNSADYRKAVFHGENQDYSLDVRLCPEDAGYYSYVPTAFLGEFTVELAEGEYSLADALPDDTYREPLRPRYHFTAAQGWNNDPNGLVYYEGRYHMFFQHNPAGNQWGNMHWGHAVSDDLLHWTELEIALYPDDLGTMFSGSAIIDKDNVTGFKTDEHDPLLLFYTAAGNPFTQCLAYSTDGAKTFVKYEKNPIIPNVIGANRDPKVIYCDELGCYVLALYLDGNTYTLFRSDNLLDWSEYQRIELPGDAECPDFYPLTLYLDMEDGSVKEERYWVFSGASDRYFIGKFVDGKYTPVQDAISMHDGANTLYASQTFSDVEGRRIRISWDRGNLAAENNMRWGCSMSVPSDMKLCLDDKGTIRLCASPVPELRSLSAYAEVSDAYQINAKLCLNRGAKLKVFGCEIPFDPQTETEYPCETKARIYVDTLSVEVYFGHGEYYTSRSFIPDRKAEPLEIEGGSCGFMTVNGMSSTLK